LTSTAAQLDSLTRSVWKQPATVMRCAAARPAHQRWAADEPYEHGTAHILRCANVVNVRGGACTVCEWACMRASGRA
jgi:hypothetical protein